MVRHWFKPNGGGEAGGRHIAAPWTFIPAVGPKPRGLGPSGPGGQHRDRSVVGKNRLRRQHMPPNGVRERLQQCRGFANPIRQGRAFQIKAFAADDLALAIQRQMVGILVDPLPPSRACMHALPGSGQTMPCIVEREHMRQQARIPFPDRRMPAFAEKGTARARSGAMARETA